MQRILIFAVALALARESNDIIDNEDPGDCVCDLTRSSCDMYCCCDDDCGSLTDSWDKEDPADNKCLANRFTDYPNKLCKANETDNVSKIRRGKKTS